MANKYDQTTASINAGAARRARPSLNLDMMVFIVCMMVLAFWVGLEVGLVKGEARANGVCKITCVENGK